MNKLSKILVSTTFLVALSLFGFGIVKGYGSATENITPADRTSFENTWDDLGTTDGTSFTPTFDSSSNLRFSGTTFPFAEVELNLFSTQITGKTNADSKGAWEIVVKQTVATGDHTAYITTKAADGKVYRAATPYIITVNTAAKTAVAAKGVLIAQATTTPTVTTTTPTVTTAPKTTSTPAVATAPATAEAATTGAAVTTDSATSGTVATTGTVAGTTTTDAEDNKSKDSGNAFWWFIAGIAATIIAFRVFRKKGNDDLDLLMDKNAKPSKKEKKAVEKEEIEAEEEEAETEDEEVETEEEVVAEPVKKVQPQQNQQKQNPNQQKQNQNQQKKNKNRKSW